MRTLPAVVVLLALAAAGCSDHPAPAPSLVGHHAVVAGANGTVVSANRGSLRTADFEMASGVTTLVVHSGDLGGGLYRISTPAGAGQVPTAVVDDGQVVAQLNSSGTNGPSIVDVELSDAVAWTIHLDGGATVARVDMHEGGLATLDFGAGVTRIDATVPRGAVTVRMSGGASEFDVHAPDGVPARVTMGGGGSSATIDGTQHTGIAGGTVFAPSTWPSSGPRVDVDNTAGVSTFTLDRY
ncbi:MAG TPA: hypothetical protein VGF84_00385 [Micromonosporaceae bacterium]